MEKQLRALIIEDSQDDALLLVRELQGADYEVNHTRVDNADDLSAALENHSWDIILSESSMLNFSATAALELMHSRRLDIPFIIVSETTDLEAAVAAMKAGAHDYFQKGRTTRLAAAIERELREAQERDQRKQAEEEVRRVEERLAKAFQASPVGITITSSEGLFLSVNDAFRRMLKFTSDDIIGRAALELGIWNNASDQRLFLSAAEGYESVRDRELILHTEPKDTIYVSVSTEPIEVSNDACVLAIWHDITNRKQAEQALMKNIALTHLLQEVTLAANEATDINDALQFAVDGICEFAGWPLGHVYMRIWSGRPQLTSSGIWHSADPKKFNSFRAASEKIQYNETTGGLNYRVLLSGEPEWIVGIDSETDLMRYDETQKAGIKTLFAFPVLVQNDVVAVMEFFSTTATSLDADLLETIPQIAAQVGHVVQRVRSTAEFRALYNATAYLFNADSVLSLAHQIVQGIVQEFEHVDCGLLLIDHQTGQINRLVRAGQYGVEVDTPLTIDGPGLISMAIRDGKIIYSPDAQHDERYIANVPSTRSEMVVPLQSRAGIIGALDLQSPTLDYFNPSDQRVLETFAERAAAALEIIRLYEEINAYAAQLGERVKERTQQLQKAKERAEAILNNSSDAIILVDKNGIIKQTNPHFVEMFGYDQDELSRQGLDHVISLENHQDLSHLLETVASNRVSRRSEAAVRRKDGTTFPADVAFSTFPDSQEMEIVCSLRDISAQKQLQQELRSAFERQKELAELKTRFISMVSHEYRTPLSVILTASSLLLKYGDRVTEDKKQRHLENIIEHVQRLTALLDDVLEINRAEMMGVEFNPEMIDLAALCQTLVEDTRQVNPHHTIEFNVVGETSHIAADMKLIRQIVSNLLSNAVKYSPNQGLVDVTLQFEGKEITLVVTDEGMGIPEEDLANLFTLFHRAGNVGQIQGTGLGLAIVKQAVEAHGGSFSVESEIEQGTVFTIRLPAQTIHD
ncbi:MAG: PAS domain S-box protein [Anaerolineae bacterium]|nr:PAS domain S-box protein [Anaerolineae bacterium]